MPLALIAAAVTAAGSGMSIAGNQQAKSAMEKTRSQYAAKQAENQRQAKQLFDNSLGNNAPEDANAAMDKGQASRQAIYEGLKQSAQPIAAALPATAATGKAGKQASGAANTWNTLNAANAAKEGGYSDWQTGQSIDNSRTNQGLSVISDAARGDARLLPLELQVAGQAGDKLSGWGQIVSQLGSLTSAAGASGMFKSVSPSVTPLSQVGKYPMASDMIQNARAANPAAQVTNAPVISNAWENLF